MIGPPLGFSTVLAMIHRSLLVFMRATGNMD
jgi:hypothetical protein